MIPINGRISGPLFVVCCLICLSVGMAVGVNASLNDTSYDAVEENMSGISENVTQQVEDDTTGGPLGEFHVYVTQNIGQLAETLGLWGASFGYSYPAVGRVLARVLPLAVLAGTGYRVYTVVKRL
jgi:hypothetical protein